jgi:hypothetical protein
VSTQPRKSASPEPTESVETTAAPETKTSPRRSWEHSPAALSTKWKLIWSSILLGCTLLLLGWGLIIPLYLQSYAEDLIGGVINGTVNVGSAAIAADGGIHVYDVSIQLERGEQRQRFIHAERIDIGLSGNPLFNQAVKVNTVHIYQPDISLIRDAAGIWNLQWAFKEGEHDTDISAADEIPEGGVFVHGGRLHLMFAPEDGHWRFHVTDLSGTLRGRNGLVVVEGLHGSAYGGELGGTMDIASLSPLAFDAGISLSDIQLPLLVRGTNLEEESIQGLLHGGLALKRSTEETRGAPLGSGWFQVEEGNIVQFPILTSLLNLITGALPGDAGIDEAYGKFQVTATAFNFTNLKFEGSPASVVGGGWILHDGSNMQLFFTPKPDGGILTGIPLIGDIVGGILALPAEMAAVEVTGAFFDPKTAWVPMGTFQRFLRQVEPPDGDDK